MATQVDLPFQRSLLKSYLERAWTRFELVSTVKEWNAEKQVSIMPTLLWGKLVDYYVELDATTKADVKQLMMALIMIKSTSCSGSTNSREVVHLSLSTLGWNSWRLHQSLKKLFKQAYPNEELTSAILLQCFLTGLTSPICPTIAPVWTAYNIWASSWECKSSQICIRFRNKVHQTIDEGCQPYQQATSFERPETSYSATASFKSDVEVSGGPWNKTATDWCQAGHSWM